MKIPSLEPEAQRRPVPVPDDPALPRLPVLLDPDAMAPYLERSLGPGAASPEVRIRFLRYKPGNNLVVCYDVALGGRRHPAIAMIAAGRSLARRARKPENVALARLVNGRSPAPMPLHHEPEIDALIQWFPLDLDLPTLAEPPAQLLDELDAAGVELGAVDDNPTTLAYVPRRRAVLRVGDHVLKLYAEREPFDRASAGLRAAGGVRGVRTPVFEGRLPERLVTVQAALSGSPPAGAADVAREAGELLRELHEALPALPGRVVAREVLDDLDAAREARLAVTPPSQQLAAAQGWAQVVATMLPTLEHRVQTLCRRLEESVPPIDRFVQCHGDFSAGQLLVTPEGLAAVDFDSMCFAPAALDLGDYAAHVVRGREGDDAEVSEVLEGLLDGYGDSPAGLSWYVATCIVRRSPEPFRYLEEDWPDRVEGMLRSAETVLGR
jgi:hypothetical protein